MTRVVLLLVLITATCASLAALPTESAKGSPCGDTSNALRALISPPQSPTQFVLRKGQQVEIANLHPILSQNAEIGDLFDFETVTNVRMGDLIVIPRHLPIRAKAVQVKVGRHGHQASMALEFQPLTLCSGEWVLLGGDPKRYGTRNYKAGDMGSTVGDAISKAAGTSLTPLSPIAVPWMFVQLFKRGNAMFFMDKGTRQVLFVAEDVALDREAVTRLQPPPYAGPPVVLYTATRKSRYALYCGAERVADSDAKLIFPPGRYVFHNGKQSGHPLELELESGEVYSIIGGSAGPKGNVVKFGLDLLGDSTSPEEDLTKAGTDRLQSLRAQIVLH